MRKTQLTTRTALLALALLLCVALSVALLMPTVVQAYTGSELTDGTNEKLTFTVSDASGDKFDQKELQKLINALAGSTNNVSVSALATGDLALKQRTVTNTNNTKNPKQGNSTTLDGIPTSEISYLANKTIIVELGGIKWIAVYLSTAKTNLGGTNTSDKVDDGDVIITLWQAYSDVTSKWANFGTENNSGGNASAKYPANMYATSLIRNTVLNAGGMEATGMNVASKKNQSRGNAYAKFTMPAASGGSNLYDYIVSPRYVSWQYDQDRGRILDGNSANGYANNESWGLVSKEQGYAYHNESYRYDNVAVNPNYSDWADDKIWLPSWTETGNSSGSGGRGIWDLYGKLEWGNSSDTYTWLRSALVNHYHYANSLISAGDSDYNIGGVVDASEFLVRPALHLNLTAAAKEVDSYVDKPTSNNEKTVTYNGTKQTFDLGVTGSFTSMVDGATKKNVDVAITSNNNSDCAIENIDGNQVLTATKAGTYKVTVTPANGYRWKNNSKSNDTEAIEFTLTISKVPLKITANNAEITYGDEAKNGGVTYSGFVNGEDESVLNGELKFTYGGYVVGSGVGSYDITPSGLTAYNYEIEFKKGTLTVNPKAITVQIANAGHVYGATAATPEISNTLVSGKWVGSDSKNSLGTIAFGLNDRHVISSSLAVGKYTLSATNGTYGNYDVTFESGVYEVTPAALDVSEVDFNLTYTYALDAMGQVVKREMTINTASVIAQGGQQASATYDEGSITGISNGYQWDGKIYSVWKAGTYTVRVTISAPNHNDVVRILAVTILKAKAVVLPSYDKTGTIYTSGSLPDITAKATVNGREVQGTIRWITSLGSIANSGQNPFTWQWVPNGEDAENVDIVEGIEYLNITVVGVSRITIQFDAGDREFFDTDELNDLKNYLTVTITFTDSTQKVLAMNEYALTCQGGTTLVAGDNVAVTVSYFAAGNPVTQSFRLNVTKAEKPVDPTPDDPVDPNPGENNPTDPEPEKPSIWERLMDFFDSTPLPLGYAALVLGAELLLIIILAIAARKPKKY